MLSSRRDSSRFDPLEWYLLARWLADTTPNNPSQCLLRTIIGRAYYAALICAREATGSDTIGEGGHRNVVKALRVRNSTAAGKLDSLRLRRQKADYDLEAVITEEQASISLRDSFAVLSHLGRYLNKSPFDDRPYTDNYLDADKFIPSIRRTH